MQPRLCVYCGSSLGANPVYRETAEQLGCAIATAGVRLVYGGGGSGLMGVIARAAKLNGGHVTGIIPTSLLEFEEALEDIDARHVVHDHHERKTLMLNMSDGFAALPGGPGTLEELSEQLSWAAYGRHEKPIYILNVDGYWNPYLALLDRMRDETFAAPGFETRYLLVEEPEELVARFLDDLRRSGDRSGDTFFSPAVG
jgi:uncharacterized protein (TIGR00730 family)